MDARAIAGCTCRSLDEIFRFEVHVSRDVDAIGLLSGIQTVAAATVKTESFGHDSSRRENPTTKLTKDTKKAEVKFRELSQESQMGPWKWMNWFVQPCNF